MKHAFLFLLLCASAHSAPFIEARFHSVWEQADGQRRFFDVPASIDLTQDGQATVRYTITVQPGVKESRELTVNAADVRLAQAHLARKRVSVALPNGGLLNGLADKIAILSTNGAIGVGLEIAHSDLVPVRDMAHRFVSIRSVHPLLLVRYPAVGDPVEVPLMDQRLLLGSVIKDWPATPVVVLGRRMTAMGPSYFVMEKRDLVDPAIRLARIYLVPMEWLRAAHDLEQYQDLLEGSLFSNKWKRDKGYTAFRHQGLTPWTHAQFYFHEDPTSFDTEESRFERRATELLKWFNGMLRPDEDMATVMKKRNCADYLYLP